MHEVGIAKSIVSIAEDYAKRAGAISIKTIALRVGAMSGVVPAALEFAFEVAKLDTLAEHASLEIDYLPMVAYCEDCELEFEVQDSYGIAICPVCMEPTVQLHQGQELDVKYLEVV